MPLEPIYVDAIPVACQTDFFWIKEAVDTIHDQPKRGSAEPSIEAMGWQKRHIWMESIVKIHRFLLLQYGASFCYQSHHELIQEI